MSTLNDKLNLIKDARDDIQTALAEKGQVVGKDIRDYAEAVANIEGGSGDVKLFETVAEMQADENPQEGDLAIVYRNEIQPVTEESEFDSCIFPNTVVLSEAFSGGNVYGSFRSTGGSYFDGSVSMSSSSFRFSGYGESSEIRVQYTSSDGITYTRNDGGEELQEFGTTIKFANDYYTFNSVFSNFMKASGNYFEGMYSYTINHIFKNLCGYIPFSALTFNLDGGINDINVDTSQIQGRYEVSKFVSMVNKIKEENPTITVDCFSFVKLSDNKLYCYVGRKLFGRFCI